MIECVIVRIVAQIESVVFGKEGEAVRAEGIGADLGRGLELHEVRADVAVAGGAVSNHIVMSILHIRW